MPNPPRTSDEIRAAFLEYFQERGHVLLPPWPLVPIGDPTSLFTSAGMQQFKPQFMGEQPPPAPRATTVQRCFRTTDIEEVGDLSHCTAFEMLGNFSFGDYFKQGAIAFAWDLLTRVYQIPAERLHATIYLDDDDAYGFWREVGLPDNHIHRRGEDLNYWFSFPNGAPGASGPCGPDSEIYYDFYPERGIEGAQLSTAPDGTLGGVGFDGERFLEIWNLVFMQLYQHPDGHRTPLPAQNIDTGSGLERVACVLQGTRSVFETDIFLPILEAAAAVMGVRYENASDEQQYVIRAMSEHCRAATLLIGDGVVPSNEGRGYVLRRVIRRAVYLARSRGVTQLFTARLAEAAITKLQVGYPHLVEQAAFIKRALNAEEERFVRTLAAGSQRLESLLARLTETGVTIVPGDEAFLLYDTFGMPLELTREIAAASGFTLDDSGFESALAHQRAMSRETGKFLKGEVAPALQALGEEHSDFVGYGKTEADSRVVAILQAGSLVDLATASQECEVILDTTPFYPEGGGQMGDRGNILTPSGVFMVEDTQASGGAIVHRGRVVEGEIRVNDSAQATVDLAWRSGAARNHTGTHLLHAALRSVLGTHVRQQGSLVTPDRLRFDFTHLEQTPREALIEVQQIANEKIRHDLEVAWRRTGYRQAVASGALAFFGDKYGNEVRVVEIKDQGETFSAELCGGTHVHHTGEIGFVHILRESAVAAGTRRIEALTGRAAEAHLLEQQERLERVAHKLGANTADVEERIDTMQSELERLRKQSDQLQRLQGSAVAEALIEHAEKLGDDFLIVACVDVTSNDALKEVADRVRAKLKPSLVILGAAIEGRPSFLAAATPDLVQRGVNAGNIVREVAKAAGGGGGGRPDLAQAGARDLSRLDAAIDTARKVGAAALTTTQGS
jgi:alanyl-tRNA synthetase